MALRLVTKRTQSRSPAPDAKMARQQCVKIKFAFSFFECLLIIFNDGKHKERVNADKPHKHVKMDFINHTRTLILPGEIKDNLCEHSTTASFL